MKNSIRKRAANDQGAPASMSDPGVGKAHKRVMVAHGAAKKAAHRRGMPKGGY